MPIPLPEVLVWTNAARVTLTGQVLGAMADAVTPIAIGGRRGSPVDDLARTLELPRGDDLRLLLVEHPPEYLFLATWEGITLDDLMVAHEHGITILTLEPLAVQLGQVPAVALVSEQLPAFEASPSWTDAADPLQTLGILRHFNYTSTGPAEHPSLIARLTEAWRLSLALMGMPLRIDAALAGPSDHMPEDLRKMTGHLSIHARLRGGSTLSMFISDQSPVATRQLTLLGDEGQFVVGEETYQLYQADGTLLDQSDHKPDGGRTFADQIVLAWRKLLGRSEATSQASLQSQRQSQILACIGACQISVRTSEPESAARLLELHV